MIDKLCECTTVGEVARDWKTTCRQCGGAETYKNQVSMPIGSKIVCIDWCIHRIVAALNAGGVRTIACCCGHGVQQGRIDLEDGRVLFIENKNERS